MKRIILLTAFTTFLALINTSCTKTEIEYVDRVVTDTVYVDRIVTEYDTVYLDSLVEISRGVNYLKEAFEPYNTNYPGALPLVKQLIKNTIESDNTIAGIMVYMGMYKYNLGYTGGGDAPIFSLITVKKVKGVFRMVKSVQQFYIKEGNRLSIPDQYSIYENAAGLPDPQDNFAKNTFAGFICRADLE